MLCYVPFRAKCACSLQSLTPGFQSDGCTAHRRLQSTWPCVGSHLPGAVRQAAVH